MNRHRRIAVLAGAAISVGLILAAFAAPLVSGELTLHVDRSPSATDAASSGPAPTLGGPTPSVAGELASSPLHPGNIPEFSPNTEAPLWPVPTFADDCKLRDTPIAEPATRSADQECGLRALPDRHHAEHRLTRVALAVVAGLVTLILVSIAAARYLLLRSRRTTQIRRWRAATVILDDIASAIVAFELDPEAPCTRPLFGDVTEPATAAFYTAYNAAQNLRTPTVPSDEEAITAFTAAAANARRSFWAADLNARTKYGQHMGALKSTTQARP